MPETPQTPETPEMPEMPTTPAATVNYLSDLLATGGVQSQSSHTVGQRSGNPVNREITRTAIATTTTISIVENNGGSTTSYVFNSADAENSMGQAVSTDGNLLIRKFEGTNAGFHVFYSGTNVIATDGTRSITNVDVLTYNNDRDTAVPLPMDDTATAGTNEAIVTYSGDYLIASVPSGSGSAESSTTIGEFDLIVDFSASINAIQTGSVTRDSAGTQNGTFSSGITAPSSGDLNILQVRYNGSAGAVNGVSVLLGGDFIGSNAGEIRMSGSGMNNANIIHAMALHGTR